MQDIATVQDALVAYLFLGPLFHGVGGELVRLLVSWPGRSVVLGARLGGGGGGGVDGRRRSGGQRGRDGDSGKCLVLGRDDASVRRLWRVRGGRTKTVKRGQAVLWVQKSNNMILCSN